MKDQEPFECCESLGCKIAHTLKAMVKETCGVFEKNNIDLTPEQFFLLNILNDNEGLILQDLADMLEKDKSAIMRHIDALEKKHFVTRATCEEDKRKKLLILTKPGMETLSKAQDISIKTEKKLTNQIQKTELDTFEQVLQKIIHKTQAQNC